MAILAMFCHGPEPEVALASCRSKSRRDGGATTLLRRRKRLNFLLCGSDIIILKIITFMLRLPRRAASNLREGEV